MKSFYICIVINELQSIRYSKVKLAYYDHVYDIGKKHIDMYGNLNSYVPNFFSSF